MAIEISNLDKEPVVIPHGSFFYLWCCDCCLRHIVFVDKDNDGNAVIGLVRDDKATEDARKIDKVVVYKRKTKDKHGKKKSNSNT